MNSVPRDAAQHTPTSSDVETSPSQGTIPEQDCVLCHRSMTATRIGPTTWEFTCPVHHHVNAVRVEA